MGERTTYAPGSFCWVDLATPDAEPAKRFYSALLGWEVQDDPGYPMFRHGGRFVAAAQPMGEGEAARWQSYISVTDADATVERVRDLGGTVHREPFDLPPSGRMAVVADPTGAAVCLWQPRAFVGAEIVNEPGAWSWNTLNTRDPERAMAFFSELLGWLFEEAGEDYWTFRLGAALGGGLRRQGDDEPGPPYWLVTFALEDLDAGVRAARDGGGRVLVPPLALPWGRMAVLQDPQGAVLSLYAGQLDP